jgi:hypothetical protein
MEASITPGVEAQVDLLEFVFEIIRYRYRVVLLTLLTGISVYAATYLASEKFEGITRIIVVEHSDPGGVSPDNRRAPEVITLVEHGFILDTISDNQRAVIMAKMRSRTFTEIFIENAGVARQLYPKLWSENEQRWIGPKPDSDAVFSQFHENVRFIDHDPKTDFLSVRIRFSDPDLAYRWANQYVEEFNLFMRSRALEEAAMKREYLLKQAESTEIVAMQKSIYRLIEAQMAVMMLAESKTEFAVEILDYAYKPIDRFSPSRKRITILVMLGCVLISVFSICLRLVLKKVRNELKNYK